MNGWRAAIAATLLLAVPAAAAVAGDARCTRVVDGDTIVVRKGDGEVVVRLAFVDAPEAGQPGGAEAMAALRRLVEGRRVVVAAVDRDRFGRIVAIVKVGDADLSAAMLASGHAWQFTRYDADPGRRQMERRARTAGRGLWAKPATEPWLWRRGVVEAPYRFRSRSRRPAVRGARASKSRPAARRGGSSRSVRRAGSTATATARRARRCAGDQAAAASRVSIRPTTASAMTVPGGKIAFAPAAFSAG